MNLIKSGLMTAVAFASFAQVQAADLSVSVEIPELDVAEYHKRSVMPSLVALTDVSQMPFVDAPAAATLLPGSSPSSSPPRHRYRPQELSPSGVSDH